MKKLSLAFALTLLLSLLLGACVKSENGSIEAAETTSDVSQSFPLSPSWSLTDTAGKKHDFPAFAQGKTTIILFWATWCPYCKSFMPHIQSALYEYAESLDVQVFALSVFDDGDPQEYVTESGYDFVLFEKADAVAKLHEVRGTPGLLIIDGQGRIRFDLRDVQSDHLKASGNKHWQKARKKAPYWAAELRKALSGL